MELRCRGCDTVVDPLGPSPWACPHVRDDDDMDHVLVVPDLPGAIDEESSQPFVRYRARLASYAAALERGWSDEQFVDHVGSLDDQIERVWGSGFTVTPTQPQPNLAEALGRLPGTLLVKDETRNVSGSHKARHLFGLALWMAVRGDDDRPLAISSCGNAAMAAAVIAAAIARPLTVFVPEWADAAVVERLRALGAMVERSERRVGEAGDPCVLRFREAVAAGALPFGCQGPDNALTIDGGRTIGWELSEQVPNLESVFVQMGGGALASSVIAGLVEGGSAAKVFVVQAEGCAPFDRAWKRASEVGLAEAIATRSTAMWPWETEPTSAATGILDDEAYDWAAAVKGATLSGGGSVVAPESLIVRAHQLAHEHTSIDADATGTAGLAGLLAAESLAVDLGGTAAVLFTGVTRR